MHCGLAQQHAHFLSREERASSKLRSVVTTRGRLAPPGNQLGMGWLGGVRPAFLALETSTSPYSVPALSANSAIAEALSPNFRMLPGPVGSSVGAGCQPQSLSLVSK